MTTYDLHGILGVELVDARATDAAVVDRQLGPLRGPLPDGPTIRIRFVDRLAHGPLRLTGVRESGHDGDRFVVLRSIHKVPARAALPLLDTGQPLEIVAERGTPAIPLLIPLINLTALSTGVVPLHAAAFVHEGRGVLVTGWSKGGKTETLLAFLGHGASYLGDEWIYVRPDGTMSGIPEPIRLWNWHVEQLDDVRLRLPALDRLRLRAIGGAYAAARLGARQLSAAGKAARLLRAQRYVDAVPGTVAGGAMTVGPARIDVVVLVGSWTDAGVATRSLPVSEIVDRMVHSLAYERRELVARTWEHRFGSPGRLPQALDSASEQERLGLTAALTRTRAVAMDHPYPVEIDALYRALAPLIAEDPA